MNQFMHAPIIMHLEVAYRITHYLKKNLGNIHQKKI